MKVFKIPLINKKIFVVNTKEKELKNGRPKKRNEELIEKIIRLNDDGLSLREIEKEVNVSYSTVRRILKEDTSKKKGS